MSWKSEDKEMTVKEVASNLGISEKRLGRWIRNKTGRIGVSKSEIIAAIRLSRGRDFYTDDELNWKLLNNASIHRGIKNEWWSVYPSIDHTEPKKHEKLVLCSMAMNDMKSDRSVDELLRLANNIIARETIIKDLLRA